MACISPLSFILSSAATNPLFPPSRKPCKPSISKRHHIARISCNAGNQNNPVSPEGEQHGSRRDVLIGLGSGLAGAAALSYNPLFATAAPVAPDLSSCGLPTLPSGAKPTKCCPPSSTKIVDFQFPTNQPLRIRQPAHKLSDEYIAKYKEAIKRMKALPADDPRSFAQQASIHCAYCHNSYHQVGFPDLSVQVHGSWIFFPFHRWYLYFFERILGSLIDDPTFALPFWNWDHPDGMEIPSIFTDRKSPLYDALRNPNHQPPTLIDLNWNKRGVDTSGDVETNLKTLHRQFYQVTDPICFFGKPFRAGDTPYSGKTGSGTLELVHNTPHSWSGDPTQPNNENMGSLYSAGRDPLFYCHHSNVDRMASVWKSFGRNDIADSDYLESSYLFYDENKNLVSVKTKDCLDSRKLGYDYEQVELPWVNTIPTPRRTKAERKANPSKAKPVPFPFTLNKIISTVVKLPRKSGGGLATDESLVFRIEFDRREAVKFDVLINEEEDEKFATPLNSEFAGSFVNVSHAQDLTGATADISYIVPITNVLKELEATDDDSIVVTLVPQYGSGVIVKDIAIEPCSLEFK